MQLSLICAMANNRTIGRDNTLPWRLSEDLKYFKRTTMGKCIIMGRKTWESLGRVLPGRTHIVVTANTDYQAQGVHIVHSLDAAIALAQQESERLGVDEAFVIGGAALYAAALPVADRFHLTRVHANVDGDTVLEGFVESDWEETSRDNFLKDENNQYDYSICVLQRRNNQATTSF